MKKFKKARNSGEQSGNKYDEDGPQWEGITPKHEVFVAAGGMLRNPKTKRTFISNLATVRRLDLERLPLETEPEKPDETVGIDPPPKAVEPPEKPAVKKKRTARKKKTAKK